MSVMNDPFFVRNMVYGLEDSLISTTGLVVGVAASGASRKTILVTGGILVLVEALSMSFGAFVSEDAFIKMSNVEKSTSQILKYALVMFLSYVIAGLVPMLPFILSSPHPIFGSVVLALISLYTLGVYMSTDQKTRHARAGILMSVGGAILGLSIGVGSYLR